MSQVSWKDEEWYRNHPCWHLEELIGEIDHVKFIGYYKFRFTLEVTTVKGYTVNIAVGGCIASNIYRYDPEDRYWISHWRSHMIIEDISRDDLTKEEQAELLKRVSQYESNDD